MYYLNSFVMIINHGSLYGSRSGTVVVDILRLVNFWKLLVKESSEIFSFFNPFEISSTVFSVKVKSSFSILGQCCKTFATWWTVQTWVPLMDSSLSSGICIIVLSSSCAGIQYKWFRFKMEMDSREMCWLMNKVQYVGVRKKHCSLMTRPLRFL